ncbi:MAG: Lrp/AsnC family transcriptional regulator [Magnetococcales bacterium]|nr:Lrp/AsnC family transcriptional regulator [Magnetococcales bacterium]
MITIDVISRSIINNLQIGFPLSRQPFAAVAEELDISEYILVTRLQTMLSHGFLTRFGPLFNAEQMGGGLTLAAMSVGDDEFDSMAQIVNAMPEVAHNYARDHTLNMWFVLATETADGIQAAVDKIEKQTGHKVFNLPKLEEYRLGFKLKLDDAGAIDTVPLETSAYLKSGKDKGFEPTKDERAVITATQEGLPLTQYPYEDVAKSIGMTEVQLINHLTTMLERGWIRRIGVVPNHIKLGLKGNGMSVWNLPDEKIKTIGEKIGSLGYVSHCYKRPRNEPEWSYNLFVMVHGSDRSIVNKRVEEISQMLGDDNMGHEILYSSKILKKSGMRLKT